MSPSPSATTSSSPSTPTQTSKGSTLSGDNRLRTVIIVLSIFGAFLMAYVLYITLRVKRRQRNGENTGPYQGTVMNSDHLAAQITPFGSGQGAQGPRYSHNPGEDMRIAIRRPDGAWHFADSRTPFTPSGVSDLDVVPSPMSSSASLMSFNSRLPSRKALEAKDQSYRKRYDPEFDFELSPTVPPPPAYYPEPCRDHFDDRAQPRSAI